MGRKEEEDEDLVSDSAHSDYELKRIKANLGNRKKLVQLVHVPDHKLSEADMQKFESVRNPFRIKDQNIHVGGHKSAKDPP